MEQPHLDLAREAHDRLRRWSQDTIMRCEIAELDNANTLAIMQTVLVAELLTIIKPRDKRNQHLALHRFLVLMKEAYNNFPDLGK